MLRLVSSACGRPKLRASWPALVLVGLLSPWAQGATPVGPVAAAFLGQNDYGSIKGRVVWGGDKAPEPKVLVEKGQAAKDPQVCAKLKEIVSGELAVDQKTKGVRYAFVYLSKPKGKNPAAIKALLSKEAKVEIDQKNCQFIPYASALYLEQPLVLKSSDPVNHNVRMSAFNNSFNQILPPNGQTELKLVTERRPIPLACDIHPWMHGFLMVFDHPFFAVTDEDGSFEIKGVPAGKQSVVVWQEKVGYLSATAGGKATGSGNSVDVTAGKATDLGDIKLDPAKVK